MAVTRGWKRLGKVILKHNIPAVCQCGYRARLDSAAAAQEGMSCGGEVTVLIETIALG